ncbi:MAG TPA: hypothetical protein VLA88_02395, partial [Candidatus Saccharimonadales bacterium]|nr:hypothetical protein [Candidatus Saccharimonadales bacterium]
MTTLQLLEPPHIRDAANGPELDDALNKLGAFLVQAGLTDVFGARTLHKHFEVGDGEALLDTINAEGTAVT